MLLLRWILPHLSESNQFELRESQEPTYQRTARYVGFSFCTQNLNTEHRSQESSWQNLNHTRTPAGRINIDLIAIGIGLTLAALIRFNILPSISF